MPGGKGRELAITKEQEVTEVRHMGALGKGTETNACVANQGTPIRPLLARPLEWIVRKANVISFVCYVLGVAGVLMYPVFARGTYLSENALMPATADPRFSEVDANYAVSVAEDLRHLMNSSDNKHKTLQDWLMNRLSRLGVDSYLNLFPPPEVNIQPGFEWSFGRRWESMGERENVTTSGSHGIPDAIHGVGESLSRCMGFEWKGHRMQAGKRGGVNVVGIVRAPQGEGNEAVVFVTPFRILEGGMEGEGEEGRKGGGGLSEADALGIGVGLALAKIFSEVLWLSKDYVWVVADSGYGEHYPVNQWLQEYHSSTVKPGVDYCDGTSTEFKRAGIITAALVLEVDKHFKGGALNRLKVLAEGRNGQMPNLDLINTAQYTSAWREGVRFELDKQEEVEHSPVMGSIARILETVTKTIRSALKQEEGHWLHQFLKAVPSINAESYIEGLATLAKFMKNQAVGIPTGAHGAFGNYVIDAVTLRAMPATINPIMTTESAARQRRIEEAESVRKIGRLLESVVRCVNNLLEKLHHSYYLYLLCSHDKFISIGDYMIPFALLIVTMPLKAALLCIYDDDGTVKLSSLKDGQNRGEPVAAEAIAMEEKCPKSEEKSVTDDGAKTRDDGVGDLCDGKGAAIVKTSNVKSAIVVPGSDMVATDDGRWIRAIVLVSFIYLWSTVLAITPMALVPLMHLVKKLGMDIGSVMAAVLWGVVGSALLFVTLWMASASCTATWDGEGEVLASELGKNGLGGQKVGGVAAVRKVSSGWRSMWNMTGRGVWKKGDWIAVKAVMLGVLTIEFAAISAINFALALATAVVYVPMCLLSQPVFQSDREPESAGAEASGGGPVAASPVLTALPKEGFVAGLRQWLKHAMKRLFAGLKSSLRVVVALVASPPLIFGCLFCWEVLFQGNDFSVVWDQICQHLWWGTALYPCIMLACVPCNILCLLILLWN